MLQQRDKEASEHYAAALKARPDYTDAHYGLSSVLSRQGKFLGAIEHLRFVVNKRPDDAAACNDLAWIFATEKNFQNLPEALRLARRAVESPNGKEAIYLDTLGVACSELGKFEDAIAATQEAVQIAAAESDERLVRILRERLVNYEKGIAYHAFAGR